MTTKLEPEKHTEEREDNTTQESRFFLERSGEAIRPSGFKYEGTICVHVYRSSLTMTDQVSFATVFANPIPEWAAIEAAKELKERLMRRYGHEPPKKRR